MSEIASPWITLCDFVKCRNCGKIVPVGAKSCIHCLALLTQETDDE